MMLHTKYMAIYRRTTTLVALFTTLLLVSVFLSGCENSSAPVSSNSEVTIGLSLRSQEDGVYSINKDKKDYEDEIQRLCVFLLQDNVIKERYYYDARHYSGNTLKFEVKNKKTWVKFKVEKPGVYDMIVIANASRGQTRLFRRLNKRLDLENLMIKYKEKFLSVWDTRPFNERGFFNPTSSSEHPKMDFLMTAQYFNVNMTLPATESNPYILTLPSKSGNIELLRTLAKVEIIFKDAVFKRSTSDPLYTTSKYDWAWPELISRFSYILGNGWAYSYPLLPRNDYTDQEQRYAPSTAPTDVSDVFKGEDDIAEFRTNASVRCFYTFTDYPNEKMVQVDSTSVGDESIGGIHPMDYRIFFYAPETLVASSDADIAHPLLSFLYTVTDGGDWWDPKTKSVKTYRTFKNNDHSSDYLKEYCKEKGIQMKDFSDKSIFRNCNYRITIRIDKDYDNPHSAPLFRIEEVVAE